MSIQVHNMSYVHPNGDVVFKDISFSIPQGAKCAIIGNNGCGKTTLLKLLAGNIQQTDGDIINSPNTYLIPQHFGQYDNLTVGEAIGVSKKIVALHNILNGDVSKENFDTLNDDWDIENRVSSALSQWLSSEVSVDTPMSTLSGGEKTKVFLAASSIHDPSVILMDEPTNHLDTLGRKSLYDFILKSSATIVIVSHDRTALNILRSIYELTINGIRHFPMTYDEYCEVVKSEQQSLINKLGNRQKELSKAKLQALKQIEHQNKQNARGEKLSAKKGLARISMGNLKDRAECTTSRIIDNQHSKLQNMEDEVKAIQASIKEHASMKVDLNPSSIHSGKVLIKVSDLNHSFKKAGTLLWHNNLNFTIHSGNRIRISGKNGSGKSTLLNMINRILHPGHGNIEFADNLNTIHIDQEYSAINNNLTVYQQLSLFSKDLHEHELKTRLNRFLFAPDSWSKPCACLSGGERMKLLLCCLMISNSTPDIIIADEPTNNIDIENLNILARTLREYKGTLIVVSHDETFINDIDITDVINL